MRMMPLSAGSFGIEHWRRVQIRSQGLNSVSAASVDRLPGFPSAVFG
jgi:hypothetical protein